MRIAIVHYHLRPGGVTTVVTATSRVLTDSGVRHVILTGETPPADLAADIPVRSVPGAGYLTEPAGLTAAGLARTLREAARNALGAPPDLWHFHNHALGKNVLMADTVALLAAEGERLVLQLHDLAEDGRPANHALIAACHTRYPVAPQVHYVFVNSRDQGRFLKLGLPRDNASLLPNMISGPGPAEVVPRPGAPLVLYPVRGIRRKNLGEVVLLAALAPPGTRFAITRAPDGAADRAHHDGWRDFAREHRLPVEFAVVDRLAPGPGADRSFAAWRDHATHFVSTSVAEGFGFTFLEATACGRNLPHITRDYAAHGLQFPHLYDHLLIPPSMIDLSALREHLAAAMSRDHALYGRPLQPDAVERAFAALLHPGGLDFGNLPECVQRDVIVRTADHPAAARLAAALAAPPTRHESLAPWSASIYQDQLAAIYQSVRTRPGAPPEWLDPEKLLDTCLDPAAFHFLRTT